MIRLALFVLVLWALPHIVAAQEWADAYKTGDYANAARLMHAIVTDPEYVMRPHDPAPARYLSLLYSRGLGVPRDPFAACALAQLTLEAEVAGPKSMDDVPAHKGVLREREQFVRQQCDLLSNEDRLKALGQSAALPSGWPTRRWRSEDPTSSSGATVSRCRAATNGQPTCRCARSFSAVHRPYRLSLRGTPNPTSRRGISSSSSPGTSRSARTAGGST